MRPAGNLAGVEFLAPPPYDTNARLWEEIISNSGYFFTRAAGGFFYSRISWNSLTRTHGGALFISSEQDKGGLAWSGQRRYTLRAWSMANGVDTLGEFGEYETLAKARAGLKKHLTEQTTTTNKRGN